MYAFSIKKKYFLQVDDVPTPDPQAPPAPEVPPTPEAPVQDVVPGRITAQFGYSRHQNVSKRTEGFDSGV